MEITPRRSIATANTRANLQWVSPSLFTAMAAQREHGRGRGGAWMSLEQNSLTHLYTWLFWEMHLCWILHVITQIGLGNTSEVMSNNK
jgi:hypothetical protein